MNTPKERVLVADIGIGNVQSVCNAFDRVGSHPIATPNPGDLDSGTHLVIPGVGNFGAAVALLELGGWDAAIVEFLNSGRPILGICVGYQVMANGSSESPEVRGLGLIDTQLSRISKFDKAGSGLRIPHVGFNSVAHDGTSKLLRGLPAECDFYFTHSYAPMEDGFSSSGSLGKTTYGDNVFVALFENSNLMGVQFHPEKSGGAGLALLRNFAKIC